MPQGMHVAQRLNVMAIYVRDDMLPEADRPKTWTDLLNPKYKGKIVMPDPNFSSLLVVIAGTLGKVHGWQYFEKLRANDIMVVQSNQQVSDMIRRGERPIAMAADAAYVGPSRKQGMKVSILYPSDGAFVIASPSSVVKGSPNPNAAKAFADFMLSRDVQELFPSEYPLLRADRHRRPARLSVAVLIQDPPGRLRLRRSGKLPHPQAVLGGDAVTIVADCAVRASRAAAFEQRRLRS